MGTAYIGLSTGPVLGGFLTTFFGWRSIFLFAVPFGILSIISIIKLKGEWLEAHEDKFSLSSTIVFALSIIGIMYGFSEITSNLGIISLILGSLGIIFFIWLQTKVKNPLIHPKVLFDRVYVINNLTSFINYGPGIFTIFLLTLYLQNIRDLSPDQTGLLLCVQSVFIAIFSLLVGRMLDYTRPRYIAAIGMALTAIGLTIFLFLEQNTAFELIVLALAIIGSGYGLSASSSTQISVEYIDNKFYGVSTAIEHYASCGPDDGNGSDFRCFKHLNWTGKFKFT